TGDLITPALAGTDGPAVQRILAAVVRDEGLDRAMVLAPDGSTMFDQKGEEAEDELSDDDRAFALSVLGAAEPRIRNDTDSLIDIAVPIVQGDQTTAVLLGQASASGGADELLEITIPQMSAAGLVVALLAALLATLIGRRVTAPLNALAAGATAVGQGQLHTLALIGGNRELSTVVQAFNHMVDDLRASQANVAAQQELLEQQVRERTANLEQTLAELQLSVDARNALQDAVRELASPIVPVFEGILVMPLVGAIDTERASYLLSALLRGVEAHNATAVILDVTGVPVIDTQVARVLLNAAKAVKLLGAQTILVGLRPELAHTIVSLGLNFDGLIAQADLQSGVT
ncbi:MAG TPA: STAS domain-containing protein, partial [Roseiflexaceae bacterium]|nr:STAS domain-containing protein [Roseiflexaceae bacterium]